MPTETKVPTESETKDEIETLRAQVSALRAKLSAKAGKRTPPPSPRTTIDSVTYELVRRPNGVSYSEALSTVTKRFPRKDPATLAVTTSRRLKGYLSAKHGVRIAQGEDGRYRVIPAKAKTAKKTKTAKTENADGNGNGNLKAE